MAPAVHSTLQPLNNYFEGALVALGTTARSAKHTFKAFTSEHPYTSLFLFIFGISLLPMSSTVVLGTTVLIITGILTLLSAAVIFAPIMIVLVIIALSGWLAASAALAAYRVLWAEDSKAAIDSKNAKPAASSISQNERWKFFTRTLETDVRAVPKEALSPEAVALVTLADEVQASIAADEVAKLNLFNDPSKYMLSYANERSARSSSGSHPALADTASIPEEDAIEVDAAAAPLAEPQQFEAEPATGFAGVSETVADEQVDQSGQSDLAQAAIDVAHELGGDVSEH